MLILCQGSVTVAANNLFRITLLLLLLKLTGANWLNLGAAVVLAC